MFTGVIDTGEKFITGVTVTSNHSSLVSLILAINLLPVLLSPTIIVHGVVDTGEKFIIGVVVTGNHFSAVSATPVKNLLAVSTTLTIKENVCQRLSANKFVSGVVTPRNSSSPFLLTPLINIHSQLSRGVFEKRRNDPNGILRGPGDTDSCKKIEVENLVSDSL